MTNQEIALAIFLDIEGAFDKTSFDSMMLATDNRGVESTICNWIEIGHHGFCRLVEVSLTGEIDQV